MRDQKYINTKLVEWSIAFEQFIKLFFGNAQKVMGMLHGLLKIFEPFQKLFGFAGRVISGLNEVYKQALITSMKQGGIRRADKLFNVGVTLIYISLAIATYFAAPLAFLFVAIGSVVSLLQNTKNLMKWIFKNYATEIEIARLESIIDELDADIYSLENFSERLELNSDQRKEFQITLDKKKTEKKYFELEISGLKAVHKIRKYKIAGGVADFSYAALAFVSIVLSLSLGGPFGVPIAISATVLSFSVKLAIWIYQLKNPETELRSEAKILKQTTDYEMTYQHTLKKLTQGVNHEAVVEKVQNKKTLKALAAMPDEKIEFLEDEWVEFNVSAVSEPSDTTNQLVNIDLIPEGQAWELVSVEPIDESSQTVKLDGPILFDKGQSLPIAYETWSRTQQRDFNAVDNMTIERSTDYGRFWADVWIMTDEEKAAKQERMMSDWHVINKESDLQIKKNVVAQQEAVRNRTHQLLKNTSNESLKTSLEQIESMIDDGKGHEETFASIDVSLTG